MQDNFNGDRNGMAKQMQDFSKTTRICTEKKAKNHLGSKKNIALRNIFIYSEPNPIQFSSDGAVVPMGYVHHPLTERQ